MTHDAETLLYLGSPAALRAKLAKAERDGTRMGQVWAGVRRRALAAPQAFPWFVPLTAVVTQDPDAIEAARQAIRRYVATFEAQQYGMGLQFHFWCFAFPHARWSLYFDWLDRMGAWDEPERSRLREQLVTWQFLNFFYGMRTKPEPECVDNQTMSLCFSNALVGELFGTGAGASATAARMRTDGLRRLPSTLGGFPPSGYSGEGSTYMDHVVGPSIPFVVELLEHVHGGDWYGKELEPAGGSAASIVRMIAREWTPAGLTLPWDHYGYALPTRSCIAYGAHRTGDPLYLSLLEDHASWGHDHSIGWGFDDQVWSLIWWPAAKKVTGTKVYTSWAEPTVGGALVSDDASLYLMQMWDESNPGYPARSHVNPNSLVLVAHGSPLTIDGVADKEGDAFKYADTWVERTGLDFAARKENFGVGCAGAHSVLLVDGWEGMRATARYEQAEMTWFCPQDQVIEADVTPIYREKWSDVRRVRRRSRLCEQRFWLIEDLAAFGDEHEVTARFFLRPGQVEAARGVTVETAEGVRLQLVPLVGPDGPKVKEIAGYPRVLDGRSLQVDFGQRGKVCRWLWLGWPTATRQATADVSDGWQCVADAEAALDEAGARKRLDTGHAVVPMTMPAFMAADLPVARRWWYRRRIAVPAGSAKMWWLRLPRLMWDARMWVDGREVDLSAHRRIMPLLPFDVAMPTARGGAVEVLIRVDCGVSQYGDGERHGDGLWGQPTVLTPAADMTITEATCRDGQVTVAAAGQTWQVEHALMALE